MAEREIPKEPIDRIIFHLDWMTTDMKNRYDETGIEGNYSPELQDALELLESLKQSKR